MSHLPTRRPHRRSVGPPVLLLCLAALLAGPGCGRRDDGSRAAERRSIEELRLGLQEAEQARRLAERAAAASARAEARWRGAALLGFASGVAALIVGAGLGSSARRRAGGG